MFKKGMKLKINQSAKKIILSDGTHREWGARPIRRIIQSNIENIISFKYLNNEFHDNSIIEVTAKGDKLIFKESKKIPSRKRNTIKT